MDVLTLINKPYSVRGWGIPSTWSLEMASSARKAVDLLVVWSKEGVGEETLRISVLQAWNDWTEEVRFFYTKCGFSLVPNLTS